MTKYDMELMNFEITYCVLRSKKELRGLTLSERKQFNYVKQYLSQRAIWRGVL